MLAADSKGKYFRGRILNRYPYQRVHSAVLTASWPCLLENESHASEHKAACSKPGIRLGLRPNGTA
jgi:hypothetical protein